MSSINKEIFLNNFLYIYYLVKFYKRKTNVSLLINLDNKDKAITSI